jgi:hypothetical protein
MVISSLHVAWKYKNASSKNPVRQVTRSISPTNIGTTLIHELKLLNALLAVQKAQLQRIVTTYWTAVVVGNW